MFRPALTGLAAALCACCAWAAPPEGKLVGPATPPKPGRLVTISLQSADPAASSVWFIPEGVQSKPDSNGRELVVVFPEADEAKTYRFSVVLGGLDGKGDGEKPRVVLTRIDLDVPVESGAPVPPPPPDALAADAEAAYKQDAQPDPTAAQAARAKAADMYARLADAVADPAVKTGQQVADLVKAQAALDLGTSLKAVRKVFGTDFAKYAPKDPKAELTDEVRQALVARFKKYAAVMAKK